MKIIDYSNFKYSNPSDWKIYESPRQFLNSGFIRYKSDNGSDVNDGNPPFPMMHQGDSITQTSDAAMVRKSARRRAQA